MQLDVDPQRDPREVNVVFPTSFNPLLSSVPYMARLAKILISILEGTIKKIPILGYVPKNDEKRIRAVKVKENGNLLIYLILYCLACHIWHVWP